MFFLEAKATYIRHQDCDHIFFIGFFGAGKSTLAKNLGELFHRRYLDIDRLVAKRYATTVSDFVADRGFEAFCIAESHELSLLVHQQSLLVSCGGAIVENPENIRLMHSMGTIVYLEGDLTDSLRQMRTTQTRPFLHTDEPIEELFERLQKVYDGACDLRVDIRNKTFTEVRDASAQLLWEKGLL